VGRVDGRGTAHPVKEAARALRPDLVPGTRPGGLSGRRGRPAPTIARGKGGVKGRPAPTLIDGTRAPR
jgi:hypothetical protein